MADIKQLQLPSQRQLVDRMLHLIEFDTPFVLLSGRPGSGRSTLFEQLLGQLPDTLRPVTLIPTKTMKMEQVREALLRQMVPSPLFNPADALADSFLRMAQGLRQQLVILIDGVDRLPRELLAELWALMLANDALPRPHRLAILLTADEQWARQHRPLLKGRALPALEVELAPLTAPEQKIFLYEKGNQLKVPSLLLTKEKVVEILAVAKGHPATIMMSLEDLMSDRRPRKRPEPFPIRKAAIGLAATALVLLGLTYLVPAFMGGAADAPKVESVSGTLPPPVPTGPVSTDPSQPDTPATPTGSAPVVQEWKSEKAALPEQVKGDTLTTESQNYEGRRVVIADEVVQQLMKDKPVSGALPTEVQQAVVPGKQVIGEPQAPAKPAAVVKPAPEVKPVPERQTVSLTPAKTLNQKRSNHFSVQLMGASNMKAVEEFVGTHKLAGQVWVYQTQFRGNPWYVVLKGDYATLEQARAAIRQLPPPLLKEQPWPKSFAQVKKELKK